jgi:quercetin dioxygenase-like cupin family protein
MESVRRIVTKENKEGKVTLFLADQAPFEKWPGADAGSVVVWSTASVPADNSDGDLEGSVRRIGLTLHGGSVFRVTELGPGFRTPMHRTLSTDYCFVLSGTLELILDGGDRVTLRAGEALVQRGTNHAWRNPSTDAPCKFMVCMIEAEMVLVDGVELKPTPVWKMFLSSLPALLTGRQPKKAPADSGARTEPAGTQGLRRVVTAHDRSGKAQILSDEQILLSPCTDAGVAGATIWESESVPINNSSASVGVDPPDLKFLSGSACRVTELEPGIQTSGHRNQSIDYCMVLSGELELILDGGETIRLSAGEAVVQRGTGHAWRNPNKQLPARFVTCMIEAKLRYPWLERIPGTVDRLAPLLSSRSS